MTTGLDAQVKDLEAGKADLKTKIRETLARTNKRYQLKLTRLQSDRASDNLKIQTLRSDYAALDNMLQAVEKEKAVLGVRSAQAERTVITLRDDLEITLRQCKRSKGEEHRLSKEVAKLKEENLVFKNNLLRSERYQEEVNRLNKELRAGNLGLEEELRESAAKRLEESSKQTSGEVGTLRAHNLRLKEEVRRSVANYRRLEVEANKTGSTLKMQIERLEDDLEATRNLLATANLEGRKSTHLLDMLRNAKADLEIKNRNLQQRCGRLEKKISVEVEPTTETRDLANTIQSLCAQLLAQSAKVITLEENCRSAREENARLEGALALEMGFVDQIRDEMLSISNQSDRLRNFEEATREVSKIGTKKEALENDPECLLKFEEEEKPNIFKEEFD